MALPLTLLLIGALSLLWNLLTAALLPIVVWVGADRKFASYNAGDADDGYPKDGAAMARKGSSLIPAERIERAILLLRGQKVMLDVDFAVLRSQTVTSSSGWGGRRTPPWAFTQEGVAMLSSVLRSDRAIQVNIEIMRAFVRLRELLASHVELARRLDDLEREFREHDERCALEVFDVE